LTNRLGAFVTIAKESARYKSGMNVRPGPPGFPGRQTIFNNDAWWLHDLFILIGLVIVAGAVLILVRMLRRPALPAPPQNWAAIHELDLRYAKGEIKRDDYLQRRADLLGVGSDTTPGPAAPAP
jgi:hypothetical protein